MSDDDFMMEDEEEDYDFEYEDGSDDDMDLADGEEGEMGLENAYYSAKSLKEDDLQGALKALTELRDRIAQEEMEDPGDWGFKVLKQLTKIKLRLGDPKGALEDYTRLLTWISPESGKKLSKNYTEKSLDRLLETVGFSSRTDSSLLEAFYQRTLDALGGGRMERQWVRITIQLAKLWLDQGKMDKLAKAIQDLHQSCLDPQGQEDPTKGTTLLEIYALEIQMYTRMRKTLQLKKVYQKSLNVTSAIPHPKIMGVIRECGGKMYMRQGEWVAAKMDFYEAFRSYDEAGSHQRIQVLKYLVLASMLTESDIDPFDSQETRAYKEDPEILAMTTLVTAYQKKEISTFEHILQTHQESIMGDPFIREHIDSVLRTVRIQALVDLIKPYDQVRIPFLSEAIHVDESMVLTLLEQMIRDGKIQGYLDQVDGILHLQENVQEGKGVQEALDHWIHGLDEMSNHVLATSYTTINS